MKHEGDESMENEPPQGPHGGALAKISTGMDPSGETRTSKDIEAVVRARTDQFNQEQRALIFELRARHQLRALLVSEETSSDDNRP
jgi:hypothetical protein